MCYAQKTLGFRSFGDSSLTRSSTHQAKKVYPHQECRKVSLFDLFPSNFFKQRWLTLSYYFGQEFIWRNSQQTKILNIVVNAMFELIDEICRGSANFFSFWEPLTQVWLGNKAQQCKQKSHLFMKHVLCAKKLSFQIGTSIVCKELDCIFRVVS